MAPEPVAGPCAACTRPARPAASAVGACTAATRSRVPSWAAVCSPAARPAVGSWRTCDEPGCTGAGGDRLRRRREDDGDRRDRGGPGRARGPRCRDRPGQSEEHTSELQSRGHLVCRLLLVKKNKTSVITIRLTLL